MWLFMSNAYLSIVAHKDSTSTLLVRSRVEGHIQAVFNDAEVFTDPNADYFFRSFISRHRVADAIAKSVEGISYYNFKNSVSDTDLHASYFDVWCSMRNLQEKLLAYEGQSA